MLHNVHLVGLRWQAWRIAAVTAFVTTDPAMGILLPIQNLALESSGFSRQHCVFVFLFFLESLFAERRVRRAEGLVARENPSA